MLKMMQQQMMIQQQIEAQNLMVNQQIIIEQKEPMISVRFDNVRGTPISITVKYGTTIEELLNIYLKRVNSFHNEKIKFLYNALRIKRDEKRTVFDFFQPNFIPKITVID